MNILVLNAGSSSLKFQLIARDNWKVLAKGYIENIGQKGGPKNHEEAIAQALRGLPTKDIQAIGHRVVHGGDAFKDATIITDSVMKTLEELATLAPLHNPPGITGIRAAQKLLPQVQQVAVFDTAFHQTLPEKAYLYAIPHSLSEKYKIRRYGFHGTSHKYVAHEAIRLLQEGGYVAKKAITKIVTCHLGNGSSITAVLDGRSIDTSMGFTPLEGIPMGTRSGDIDPAIVPFLQKKEKQTPEEIDHLLNFESGFLGLCGTQDMRDVWAGARKGDYDFLRVLGLFCYRIAKYIGAYAASLNGLDALVFTAAIGENAWYVRNDVCSYLTHLGVDLDHTKNQKNEGPDIASKESRVRVFVIPTNEELQIAKEVAAL